MNCGTENIIYLITCRKCGIQYVGETGQSLRKGLNNHRNRLKKLSCQYLYQHFNSDGHTEDDINIVPIEAVELTPTDKISLSALCKLYILVPLDLPAPVWLFTIGSIFSHNNYNLVDHTITFNVYEQGRSRILLCDDWSCTLKVFYIWGIKF